MTAWVIIGAMRRHRPALLLGLLLTLGVAFWASSVPGVYYERVNVVFLAPPPPHNANAYQLVGSSLIASASVVRLETALAVTDPQPVAPRITIVDEGVRHGTAIRMPNSGGQWAYVFDRPVLDIQVAGSSPAETQARLKAAVAQVVDRLRADQDAYGVRADQRIDTALSPPFPPVLYRQGSRMRAVGASALLGLGLTLGGVLALDRWTARRLLRRGGSGRGTPQGPVLPGRGSAWRRFDRHGFAPIGKNSTGSGSDFPTSARPISRVSF